MTHLSRSTGYNASLAMPLLDSMKNALLAWGAPTAIIAIAVFASPSAAPAATIAPDSLQLLVPAPAEALRLAHYKTYPDELVVDKVKNLERVAREANPDAKTWSIYLTPQAATILVKGWKGNLNTPDTPMPEATLGKCLDWLCRHVPDLQYGVVDTKILIDVKKQKGERHNKPNAGDGN